MSFFDIISALFYYLFFIISITITIFLFLTWFVLSLFEIKESQFDNAKLWAKIGIFFSPIIMGVSIISVLCRNKNNTNQSNP